MASSSSRGPAPFARGNLPPTLVPTQGATGLQVVTYNIGAKTDLMFAGPKKQEFQQKLEHDLAYLAEHDVIFLQECSDLWAQGASILLPGHNRTSGEDGMVTLIRRGLDHHEPFRSIRIFPDDLSKYRFWRRYSQVALPHGISIKAPKTSQGDPKDSPPKTSPQ